jgi:dTDP-4-dehydrorhamnose reductase
MDLKNKRILVTGSSGQLGSAILKVFKNNNIDVVGADRNFMDITNRDQVFDVINKIQPEVIIHCAAYTAVDKAEEDKENCYKTNVDGTRNLSILCKEMKILLIYFSTDYVFDGKKNEPYEVKDIPNPINYYGLTKYLGEEIIKTYLNNFYIFRISWVFGPNGKNFVNTIIRLAKENPSINVVNDQVGSPTYTIDVANFLLSNSKLLPGIYHLSNEGFISWFDFASEIIRLLNIKCTIKPILTSDYKSLAKRGMNSRLLKTNNCLLKNWKLSLKDYLSENYN